MKKLSLITFLIVSLLLPSSTIAGEQIERSKGQTIFIPAAWTDHSYETLNGTVKAIAVSKLNIWNIDPENSIWISEIKSNIWTNLIFTCGQDSIFIFS